MNLIEIHELVALDTRLPSWAEEDIHAHTACSTSRTESLQPLMMRVSCWLLVKEKNRERERESHLMFHWIEDHIIGTMSVERDHVNSDDHIWWSKLANQVLSSPSTTIFYSSDAKLATTYTQSTQLWLIQQGPKLWINQVFSHRHISVACFFLILLLLLWSMLPLFIIIVLNVGGPPSKWLINLISDVITLSDL